jgi:hypothetical protein
VRERVLAAQNGAFTPYRYQPAGDVPPMAHYAGPHIVRFTGSSHDERGYLSKKQRDVGALNTHLTAKIDEHVDEIALVESDGQAGAETLILSYGITARSAAEAVQQVRAAGRKVSLLTVYSLWPVPEQAIHAALVGVRRVIVPELNLGLYRREIERLACGAVEIVGDIHRGGVIASIVGTLEVIDANDRARLKGFIINKFHGDVNLFENGKAYLEETTKLPCLGIIPNFPNARNLPAEDAVALEDMLVTDQKDYKICVLKLPRIANFDDLDPLRLEPGVSVRFLDFGQPIPGDAKLVIIPGSKSTMADLASLRATGWDIDLKAHVRRGRVLDLRRLSDAR